MPPTNHYVAKTDFRVRYVEADSMHIVHHSMYITYFEEGRSDYARKRGYPYGKVEKEGIYLLVTEINVRYHKPAHYEDCISLYTWISKIQSRGLVFNYEMVNLDNGMLLVTGSTKHICATPCGEIARVPEAWRYWGKPISHT